MPSISIENGKRIEELLEVTRISDQSFFLVSETDLTRKITLTYLRNAFNGDIATENLNNLYYSVEKINELLDHVWDDIGKYVEQIYAELKLADKNLNTKIDNLEEDLRQEINRVETELDARLEVVENKLANITGIDIGTAVPSTLANGRIYLQYF